MPAQVHGSSVFCTRTRKVVVKSYNFYMSYARAFPECFRETTRSRFLSWHAYWHRRGQVLAGAYRKRGFRTAFPGEA